MTAVVLHEVAPLILLQDSELDGVACHVVVQHSAVAVGRHEKVAGMIGVGPGGVIGSAQAAAAERKNLADVLGSELAPMVVQEMAAVAAHTADALVAEAVV